jgi:alpha-tubulin suppressor-like RCC1 family protein
VRGQPRASASPVKFSSISTGNGAYHACGLDAATGLAFCWGDNHAGALGIGPVMGSDIPLMVHGQRRFNSISVAYYATCGVEVGTGFGYCWGSNDAGQLGNGTTATQWIPAIVAGGSIRFASISSGGNVTCGVEADTRLGYCWGVGLELDDGTIPQRSTPTLVTGGALRFSSISAGGHSCGIEAETGLAYCWGENDHGQLGNGTRSSRREPTLVGNGSLRFSSIDAGPVHTCGIEALTGIGYCWGQNKHGQLGDATTTDRLLPTPLAGHVQLFSVLDAGWDLTCGIQPETQLGYCWGIGGQTGDGTTSQRSTPALVGAGSIRFSTISAASCGVEAETGRGYCWGLVPTPVPLPF